jgi:hypothetical protein
LCSENIALSRPKLEFKKGAKSLDYPDNQKILHPKTSVISRFMYILGLNTTGIGDLSLPDSRNASNQAQIRKDVVFGTTMVARPRVQRL